MRLDESSIQKLRVVAEFLTGNVSQEIDSELTKLLILIVSVYKDEKVVGSNFDGVELQERVE